MERGGQHATRRRSGVCIMTQSWAQHRTQTWPSGMCWKRPQRKWPSELAPGQAPGAVLAWAFGRGSFGGESPFETFLEQLSPYWGITACTQY